MEKNIKTKEEIAAQKAKAAHATPKTKYDVPADPAHDTYVDAGQTDPNRARQDHA